MSLPTRLIATAALVLCPGLILGGCAGTQNRGLESVHQPVVSQTDYVFDVIANGNGLASTEQQRLAGWMASLHLGYGDRVAIDDPAGLGGGVRDDIATEVARYGLLVSDQAPLTNSPVAPGSVRIVISRTSATVPGCPDFSRVDATEFESNTGSNQGCANNSNLAAMVANPGDLVRGQAGTEVADAATANKAIDTYRTAVPTGTSGLKSEKTGSK